MARALSLSAVVRKWRWDRPAGRRRGVKHGTKAADTKAAGTKAARRCCGAVDPVEQRLAANEPHGW